MSSNRSLPLMIAVSCSLLLAACGGGGSPTPDPVVPDPGVPANDPTPSVIPTPPTFSGVVHGVTSTSDRGAGSLRECLEQCAAGDQIRFDASLAGSTITLEKPLVITCDVHIRGPAPGVLKISGQNTTRLIEVEAGITAVIQDLWLQDGAESSAAGVLVNGATLFLDCVAIDDHDITSSSGRGGGMQIVNDGTVIMTDCVVQDCSAYNGAGIVVDHGTLVARRCIISDNTTTGNAGAGVLVQDEAYFENCVFCDNKAVGRNGGALAVYADPVHPSGDVTLVHCTLKWNEAENGAAISNNGGTVRLYGVAVDSQSTLDPTIHADIFNTGGVFIVEHSYVANGTNSPLVDGVDGNRVGTHAAPLALGILGLADMGGHLLGLQLDPSSILIDAVPPSDALDVEGQPLLEDSSGNPRPVGLGHDVGATEYDPLNAGNR